MKDCSVIDFFIHYSNWYIVFWCPQNMVGPGEVDEDLQPEVTEECTKYGEVSNCLVYEVRPQCMYHPLSPPTRLQSRDITITSTRLFLVLLTLDTHARSEGYCSCPVCVCVCVCVCVSTVICRLTHWNHKREIPTESLQYRNHFKFCRFSKNALFKSYGVICSPRAAPAS